MFYIQIFFFYNYQKDKSRDQLSCWKISEEVIVSLTMRLANRSQQSKMHFKIITTYYELMPDMNISHTFKMPESHQYEQQINNLQVNE